MEEKERYELKIYAGCEYYSITDTKEKQQITIENTINLLNQQDKRIKELEETNKVLSNELTKNSILKKGYIETCCGIPIFEIPKIKEGNQQLKQLLCLSDSNKVYEKYFELKQQLAEKDKEIEQLTEELDYKNFWNDFVDLYTGNKLKTQMLHENYKDKISFAVEQLEVARRRIDRLGYNENKCLNKKDCIEDCLEEIDNQIKELKGEE